MSVPLFLQVLKYNEEEREEGKEREREGWGKGKWKKKGEGRKEKEIKNTYLGCESCNSVKKEQAGFKVTQSLVILILDYNIQLWPPVLFFLLTVTEIVIPNPKQSESKMERVINSYVLTRRIIKQWSMGKTPTDKECL